MNINEILDDLILEGRTRDQFNDYIKYSDQTTDIDVYKYVILNKLSEVDRRILLLYAECGNLREAAVYLGCSFTKLSYLIRNIRKKINRHIRKL